MKPKLYIETSVVSYLAARPSKEPIAAARQKITQEFWKRRLPEFDARISPEVLAEIGLGDAEAAEWRAQAIAGLKILATTVSVLRLAEAYIRTHSLPKAALRDAAHIAAAAIYGMDFLATWNCKHIANAQLFKKLTRTTEAAGYTMLVLCTPEALMEATPWQ